MSCPVPTVALMTLVCTLGGCMPEPKADTPPETCPSCKEKCEFLNNTCYTPDCEGEGIDPRIK